MTSALCRHPTRSSGPLFALSYETVRTVKWCTARDARKMRVFLGFSEGRCGP